MAGGAGSAVAEAMRPESPVQYRAGLAERWHVDRWVSPVGRMTLRSMERRPWRAALSLIGMAMGVGVMILGMFMFDAIDAVRDVYFERAQRDIEVAASLAAHGDPLSAPIGLEAGVIAMLSGREEAARKSWESVVALAPDGPEALTAKGYIDQIGPAPTSSAPAAVPAAAAPETPR